MPHSLSAAAEDCLKTIYLLSERDGQATVGALAERLGVTSAAVSAMLRRLAERRDADDLAEANDGSDATSVVVANESDEIGEEDGTAPGASGSGPYVVLTRYRGVTLTAQGRAVAVGMLRRHRLLELFLVRELEVPPDHAHIEAECLEHDLSEDLEGRISARLGHPTRGIHGQPIPTRDGALPIEADLPLSALNVGESALVVAIPPYDPELVRYLTAIGVAPGVWVTSEGPVPYSDSLSIRIAGDSRPIGMTVAQSVLVQRAESGDS